MNKVLVVCAVVFASAQALVPISLMEEPWLSLSQQAALALDLNLNQVTYPISKLMSSGNPQAPVAARKLKNLLENIDTDRNNTRELALDFVEGLVSLSGDKAARDTLLDLIMLRSRDILEGGK